LFEIVNKRIVGAAPRRTSAPGGGCGADGEARAVRNLPAGSSMASIVQKQEISLLFFERRFQGIESVDLLPLCRGQKSEIPC
jgi:hypothetical protein